MDGNQKRRPAMLDECYSQRRFEQLKQTDAHSNTLQITSPNTIHIDCIVIDMRNAECLVNLRTSGASVAKLWLNSCHHARYGQHGAFQTEMENLWSAKLLLVSMVWWVFSLLKYFTDFINRLNIISIFGNIISIFGNIISIFGNIIFIFGNIIVP